MHALVGVIIRLLGDTATLGDSRMGEAATLGETIIDPPWVVLTNLPPSFGTAAALDATPLQVSGTFFARADATVGTFSCWALAFRLTRIVRSSLGRALIGAASRLAVAVLAAIVMLIATSVRC